MDSEEWLKNLDERVGKIEAVLFPVDETHEHEMAKVPDPGYGNCGFKGHPLTAHICQSAGVPLSADHFKWVEKDKLPFLTEAPLDGK